MLSKNKKRLIDIWVEPIREYNNNNGISIRKNLKKLNMTKSHFLIQFAAAVVVSGILMNALISVAEASVKFC